MRKYHFESIASTNDWAKENAHLFDTEDLTLITADSQTSGRGRFSRTWHSPPKQNIYATFVFFLNEDDLDTSKLVQLLASLTQSVLQKEGIATHIKWPNDLLIGTKKLAGILIETVSRQNLACVIMGIGINVNMPKEDLEQLGRPATSLLIETGREWDSETIIQSISQELFKKLFPDGKVWYDS